MLAYEHHPQYNLAHCLMVKAKLPNRVFAIEGDQWFCLQSEVFMWLSREIGLFREDWEYGTNKLWFRRRSDAMRFKLTWA
jgi:hypothetical protein